MDGTLQFMAFNRIGSELTQADFFSLIRVEFCFKPYIVGIADVYDSLASLEVVAFGYVCIVDGTGYWCQDIGSLLVFFGIIECCLGLLDLELGLLDHFRTGWYGCGSLRYRRGY